MLELNWRAALAKIIQRRIDQGRSQAIARDQRPARAAAGGERLADHGRGELGRAVGRIDIERGEQERLYQPRVKRPLAGNRLADCLAGTRP